MLSPVPVQNSLESLVLTMDEPPSCGVFPDILLPSAPSVQLVGWEIASMKADIGPTYNFTGCLPGTSFPQ